MSSDFAPELRPHDYGPTPEDSAHRSLDAAMARTDSPASGERLSASREQAPSDVGVDLAALLAEAFDEWLFRMHGVTSSCGHEAEGAGLAEAVLASDWLAARDADLTARAEARGAAAWEQRAWDAVKVLGFDTDGDETPAARVGWASGEEFMRLILEARADHDVAYDEGRRDGAAAVLAAVEKAAKNAHECPPVRAARAATASYTRDGAK